MNLMARVTDLRNAVNATKRASLMSKAAEAQECLEILLDLCNELVNRVEQLEREQRGKN